MSCSDFTRIGGYQNNSSSNDHQVRCQFFEHSLNISMKTDSYHGTRWWQVLGPHTRHKGESHWNPRQPRSHAAARWSREELQQRRTTHDEYHDMEMLSTLLALCEGNPPVTPHKGSVKGSFDFFIVSLIGLLKKQSWLVNCKIHWNTTEVILNE